MHLISSIAIYTYEEYIEQLIRLVEEYWDPNERKILEKDQDKKI